MYDIRQFRTTLYLLLFLGFSAFGLATSAVDIWVLSIGALVANAWLVGTRRYRPLPRWVAGAITTILFLITALRLWDMPQQTAVQVLGQFLVYLQLVKLYEVRSNRDYAQLLILSVLLVVAAAINSASLVFGLVLIGHVFVSLYACLLFHLKLETDAAKALIGLSEDNLPPDTLRQDQRYLGRSMRRLTILISSASISAAVLIFLFFPRMSGANLLGPLNSRTGQSLTGFSDQVDFQNIARITQNTEPVAYVQLFRNDQPVLGTTPLLLRGRTYDVYSGNNPPSGAPWQWSNSHVDNNRLNSPFTARGDETRTLVVERQPAPGVDAPDVPAVSNERWRQRITLEPNGSRALFALAGPVQIRTTRDRPLVYHHADETIDMPEAAFSRFVYDVVSRGKLDPVTVHPDLVSQSSGDPRPLPDRRARRLPRMSAQSNIDPQILEFARRPEVSGEDDDGALVERRDDGAPPSDLDLAIANSIASYLRNNFQYTLDLTDARRIEDRDPMVAFLYDFKRGHCEYFAGAMTLMLQGLGIEARMVTGFRSDEFNSWGEGYYIVRQSHAHAWVEVLGPNGWETFDPTSSRLADTTVAEGGVWQSIKHAFNYLEYIWAESVVAYDRDARASIVNSTGAALDQTAQTSNRAIGRVRNWMENASNFYSVTQRVITGLVLLLIGFTVAVIAYFFFERWRLRQRAQRIGLSELPKAEQLRLARQLEFYDSLTQKLHRRGIRRAPHLTPQEFSRSLAFLPGSAFDAIQRLTDVFYRVRYGQRQLSSAQQKHLVRSVDRLDATLG